MNKCVYCLFCVYTLDNEFYCEQKGTILSRSYVSKIKDCIKYKFSEYHAESARKMKPKKEIEVDKGLDLF